MQNAKYKYEFVIKYIANGSFARSNNAHHTAHNAFQNKICSKVIIYIYIYIVKVYWQKDLSLIYSLTYINTIFYNKKNFIYHI